MIKLNEELFNDNFDLFKLVAVERLRFNRELLNVNGFRDKLNVIKYSTVESYAKGICEDYETLEELEESETFCLIFGWLIDEAVHHLYFEDLEEYGFNDGESLTRAITTYIFYTLTSCYINDVEV